MGILAVLFTTGLDPEKRPVQALEESSGSFRKGTPEFLVPGVSFGREVISSRLVYPFGHKLRRAWPEKSKSESSLNYGSNAGAFLAHVIGWVGTR